MTQLSPNANTPPTLGEINNIILQSGDWAESDTAKLEATLDAHARVFSTFIVETIPPGFPPVDVRKAWIGTELPVRARPYTDGITILAFEAVGALEEAGADEAVDWWKDYYSSMLIPEDPNQVTSSEAMMNISALEFAAHCGRLDRRLPRH